MSGGGNDLLFVYGTLMSEVPSSMSKFLRRRAHLLGKATAPGRLIDLGGYPAFIGGEGALVRGELYRIDAQRAEESWQLLDAYEGVSGSPLDDYRKVGLTVTSEAVGEVEAIAYEYQQAAGDRPVIAGGNYLPFYRQNSLHQNFTGHH